MSIAAVEVENTTSSSTQELSLVTHDTTVWANKGQSWMEAWSYTQQCFWGKVFASCRLTKTLKWQDTAERPVTNRSPCSSDPSAKPQSSRPSHTRLAGRHFPLAHWNSPTGHRGTGVAGPQNSSSDWSAQSGWPSQRRAGFKHGPLQGWG